MKNYLAVFAMLTIAVLLFGCLNSNENTNANQTSAIDQIEQSQNTSISQTPLPEDTLNDTIQDIPEVSPNDYDKLA